MRYNDPKEFHRMFKLNLNSQLTISSNISKLCLTVTLTVNLNWFTLHLQTVSPKHSCVIITN